MKKFYTALLALGLATNANAQNLAYQLDSSFNSKGFRFLSSSSGTDNVKINACYLNDDKTSFIAGDLGPTNNHYLFGAKLKINGEIDSTLCGSICASNGSFPASTIEIFKLQNNYYLPNSGFGGTVMHGLNPTTMDNQAYDPSGLYAHCSAQLNDSVIVEGIDENGSPGVFAYNARTAGSGYGGWNGYFVGTNYGHGDYISFPTITMLNNVKIQAIAVQSDKKILVAGSYKVDSTNDVFIARFKVGTVTLDSTFGTNGIFRIVGVTQANTNKFYSMIVGKNDTIYASYGIGIGGFPYYASIKPNGGFNTKFNGGGANTFTGQIPGFGNAKLILLDNNKLLVTGNYSAFGQIYNTADGSFHNYLPDLAPTLANFSNYIIKNVKTNAAGDLMIVGSVDSNAVSRGLIVRLKKVISTPTALSNQLKPISIDLYPNPASNVINIDMANISSLANYNITSMDGKQIKDGTTASSQIDISALQSGVYFLQIKSGNLLYNAKFIKQ
jgi:Secretion system C-terminal sorting domain